MILNRTVFLNPVEPEYLALRVSSGIDTKVNLFFKKQDSNSSPYSSDLAAQLQLTSRSRNITKYLSCPSIDTVNGVARVTIPADTEHDPNGWNLRLTGTVDQEPRVLAYGVMTTIAGAGPQVEPQDVIDTIDLTLTRGQVAQVGVKLWDDAGGTNPFDLTEEGTTVTSSIYAARSGAVLVPFTVTVVAPNEVSLTLTVEQVGALPDLCWWSLVASNAAGAHTLCEGDVTVKDLVGTYMISLYYLATSGQTAFPVTVPDRFGHVAAFTAQTVPHVSRGGVRISPVDGFNVAGDTITLVNPAGDDEPITIDVWEIA